MKKFLAVLLIACLFLTLAGCMKTKILHRDHCGTEIKVSESSNMEEDWIIYCKTCNEEFFGDDPLLGND